jgi:hypothetical protein
LAPHGPTRVFEAVFEAVRRKYLTKRGRVRTLNPDKLTTSMFLQDQNQSDEERNERIGNARSSLPSLVRRHEPDRSGLPGKGHTR